LGELSGYKLICYHYNSNKERRARVTSSIGTETVSSIDSRFNAVPVKWSRVSLPAYVGHSLREPQYTDNDASIALVSLLHSSFPGRL